MATKCVGVVGACTISGARGPVYLRDFYGWKTSHGVETEVCGSSLFSCLGGNNFQGTSPLISMSNDLHGTVSKQRNCEPV